MPVSIPSAAAPSRESSRPWLWAAILAGAAASLLLSIAIATQWLILGSFEGRWVYGYGQPFTTRPIAVAAAVALAAFALVRVTLHERARAWLVLTVWIIAGIGFQGLLRSVTPATFESLMISDSANSFYSVARDHPTADILDRFYRVRASAPLHAQSNMPGKVLLIKAALQVTSRPDVIAWLMIGVSTLGALLMYAVVRELFAERMTAYGAAILYLFVPGRVLFLPLMNTVTPVWVLGCTLIFLRWLRTGQPLLAVALGMALYGLTFVEPLPLVIGLLFAAIALRAIALGWITWERFVLHAVAMLLAFAATSEAVNLLFGFELIGTFRQLARHAAEFNVTEARPYQLWIWTNLEEFTFGAGPAQIVLAGAAVVLALTRPGPWRERVTQPLLAVSVGMTAVIAVTDLLGVNRGEVVRLWIFLACFIQIPVAAVCTSAGPRAALPIVIAVSCLQIALGTAMIRFVVP